MAYTQIPERGLFDYNYSRDINQLNENIVILNSSIVGFKNYIINGNFDLWQRGTSQTSHGYGSDDRWHNANSGTTKTHSRQTCSDTERAYFNATYYSRTVVSSVAGSGNFCLKLQCIEDVTCLAGKNVMLSFWARADTTRNIAIEFVQHFGTGGSPSPVITGIEAQLVPVTSSWQKFEIPVTIPSIAGKTLGTDGVKTSYTRVTFWFDAGNDYNARTANLGQQSGTFDIAQVQIEEGTIATPFEMRPLGLEQILCYRYYQSLYIRYFTAVLYSPNGDTRFRDIKLPVPMRTTPTVSPANYSNHSISVGETSSVVNTPTVQWNTFVTASAHGDVYLRLGQNGAYSGYPGTVCAVGAHCDVTFWFDAEL